MKERGKGKGLGGLRGGGGTLEVRKGRNGKGRKGMGVEKGEKKERGNGREGDGTTEKN